MHDMSHQERSEELERVRDCSGAMPDPLDPDDAQDLLVVTSQRQLIRLALVATETGARCQREGTGLDPMAWMLAPRSLFEGRNALFATLERQHCTRAILLHGLGLGVDADPATIDRLCVGDVQTWPDGERCI